MNTNEDINDDRVFAISLLDSAADVQSAESMITDAQIERYELPVGTARTVSTVLTVMLTVLFAWAFVAPIDVVAKAPGQLRPYGKPKLVQSELDGKIALIAVREGTHVKKNDMLVELDQTVHKDDYDQRLLAVQQERIKLQEMTAASVALNSIVKNPSVLPALEDDIGNLAQTVNDVYSAQRSLSQASYDASGSGATPGRGGISGGGAIKSSGISDTSGAGGLSASASVPGEMVDLKDMLLQLSNEKSRKEEQIDFRQCKTG